MSDRTTPLGTVRVYRHVPRKGGSPKGVGHIHIKGANSWNNRVALCGRRLSVGLRVSVHNSSVKTCRDCLRVKDQLVKTLRAMTNAGVIEHEK